MLCNLAGRVTFLTSLGCSLLSAVFLWGGLMAVLGQGGGILEDEGDPERDGEGGVAGAAVVLQGEPRPSPAVRALVG